MSTNRSPAQLMGIVDTPRAEEGLAQVGSFSEEEWRRSVNEKLVNNDVTSPFFAKAQFKTAATNFSWIRALADGYYCALCRQYRNHLVRRGNASSTWTTAPQTNVKKLNGEKEGKAPVHARSVSHLEAVRLHEQALVAPTTNVLVEGVVTMRQNIVKILRALWFCIWACLAHCTKLHQVTRLMAKCDDKLAKHLEAKTNYTSTSTSTQLLKSLSTTLSRKKQSLLHSSPFLMITSDGSEDIKKREQISLFARGVAPGGEMFEVFIGMRPLVEVSQGAREISNKVWELMQLLGDGNVSKVIGIAFDGCNTMSGEFNGVQVRIRSKLALLSFFVWCRAHKVQLVVVHAARACAVVSSTCNLLRQLHKFLHGSSRRLRELGAAYAEIQQVAELANCKAYTVSKAGNTRWLSHEGVAEKVLLSMPGILRCLGKIAEEDADATAGGLKDLLRSPNVIAALHLLRQVLVAINPVSKLFQKSTCCVAQIPAAIAACKDKLQNIIDNPLDVQNYIAWPTYAASLGIQTAPNAFDVFHQECGIPYLRSLLQHFDSRFRDSNLISCFAVLDPQFKEVFQTQDDGRVLLNSARAREMAERILSFLSTPGNVDVGGQSTLVQPILSQVKKNDTVAELIPGLELIRRHRESDPDFSFADMLKMLATSGNYPHLYDFACIAAVLGVGTASNERGFSKLRIILTYLRNRLGADTLNHILSISIDGPESVSDDFLNDALRVFCQEFGINRRLDVQEPEEEIDLADDESEADSDSDVFVS